jgi:hypothetical protein
MYILCFSIFNPAPSKGGSKMTLYLLNTKIESFLTPMYFWMKKISKIIENPIFGPKILFFQKERMEKFLRILRAIQCKKSQKIILSLFGVISISSKVTKIN